jgi:hypothetical protein
MSESEKKQRQKSACMALVGEDKDKSKTTACNESYKKCVDAIQPMKLAEEKPVGEKDKATSDAGGNGAKGTESKTGGDPKKP